MAAEMSEKQRIAELEQEVSRLREELGQRGDAVEPEQRDRALQPVSRGKAIAVAVAAVVLALGIMFAIFQALSTGIDKVAPRAANALTPAEPTPRGTAPPAGAEPASPRSSKTRVKSSPPARVPGL